MTMGIRKIDKKKSPAIASADIKRLEDTFFNYRTRTEPPPTPVRTKKPLIPVFLLIGVLFLALFLNANYNFINIPKIKPGNASILTGSLISSIDAINIDKNIKFSQGLMYLSLIPVQKQGFSINTKTPLNLDKNDLSLVIMPIKKKLNGKEVLLSVTARDIKFFSNALKPVTTDLSRYPGTKEENTVKIPLKFLKKDALHTNLSGINHIRFIFSNNKKEPVSIIIKDIRTIGR